MTGGAVAVAVACLLSAGSVGLAQPSPTPSPAEAASYNLVPTDDAGGRALVDKAVRAIGGPALDAIRTIEVRGRTAHQTSDGTRIDVRTSTFIAPPDRYRQDAQTAAGTMATILNGERAATAFGSEQRTMSPAERKTLTDTMRRNLLLLLRDVKRSTAPTPRIATRTVGGRTMDMVNVGPEKEPTTLVIDPQTGLVAEMIYGVAIGANRGQLFVALSDYRPIGGGLTYPHLAVGTLEGTEVFRSTTERVTINGAIDPSVFTITAPSPAPSPRPSPSPAG